MESDTNAALCSSGDLMSGMEADGLYILLCVVAM